MSLSPATPLPKPGHRFVLPALHGAAEAYVLAQAACALKANGQNTRSRAAIEKIGAKFEGLLRNQRLERDGSWRNAAYYSVILEDWPSTKQNLLDLLDDGGNLA